MISLSNLGGSNPRILRTNRNAASLAVLTLLVLLPGLYLPFVSTTILNEEQTFSILTGIRHLNDDGHPWLAMIILGFSVLFPIAKALLLLIATSALVPMTVKWRARLANLAITTGKYSLLDVLIVALLIVIVKTDGLAAVDAEVGVAFFTVAVFLAMLAGLCIHFPPPATTKDDSHND